MIYSNIIYPLQTSNDLAIKSWAFLYLILKGIQYIFIINAFLFFFGITQTWFKASLAFSIKYMISDFFKNILFRVNIKKRQETRLKIGRYEFLQNKLKSNESIINNDIYKFCANTFMELSSPTKNNLFYSFAITQKQPIKINAQFKIINKSTLEMKLVSVQIEVLEMQQED